MSLFRRKPADQDATTTPADGEDETVDASATGGKDRTRKVTTPPKGRPTPKRPSTHRQAEPPPANMREASRRLRDRERAERQAGMASGDDRYLLRRDRGEDRALVRDVVDARRNPSTFFLPITFLLIILMCSPLLIRSGTVGQYAIRASGILNLIVYLSFLLVVVDGFFIARRIRQVMARRLPKVRPNFGHYIYASQRAIMPRRFRQPKPRVGPDDVL